MDLKKEKKHLVSQCSNYLLLYNKVPQTQWHKQPPFCCLYEFCWLGFQTRHSRNGLSLLYNFPVLQHASSKKFWMAGWIYGWGLVSPGSFFFTYMSGAWAEMIQRLGFSGMVDQSIYIWHHLVAWTSLIMTAKFWKGVSWEKVFRE